MHKSQGSEYPVVLMPLYTQHYLMLTRNLSLIKKFPMLMPNFSV
ncbi:MULTISPECIES: ATP-binding domain-containing protein [Aerosakkonema]